MSDDAETTPPKQLPLASVVFSMLAAVFGLVLSVWGVIAFGLSIGLVVAVRKARKRPAMNGRKELMVPTGVLVAAILGSVIYSPVCALMDAKIRAAHEELGGELKADSVRYEPVSFSVNYVGYEFDAPGISAKAKNIRFWLDTVTGSLWDEHPIEIHPNELVVELTPAEFKPFESNSDKLPEVWADDVILKINHNDMSATVDIKELGWMDQAWVVNARTLNIEVLEKTHEFNVNGKARIELEDSELVLTLPDVTIMREGEFHAMLQGGFGAGKQLQMTLDYLNLNAIWSKYRIIDEHQGKARGTIRVSGDWDNVDIDWEIDLDGWVYYHKMAMNFDKSNAFSFDNAICGGSYRFGSSQEEQFMLKLAVIGSLTTGKRMNASGDGELNLFSTPDGLAADVKMRIKQGEIYSRINWGGTGKGLKGVTPNVILLLEELPQMDVTWEIDVDNLALQCDPLFGYLEGSINGILTRKEGIKSSLVRADGKLTINDGTFSFLGATGSITGDIIFNPTSSVHHAALAGELTGTAGSTKLGAKIQGQLSRPRLFFTGMRMSPKDFGREIYDSGDFLEPIRSARTATLFGPRAAMERNPFLGRRTGNVFFEFE